MNIISTIDLIDDRRTLSYSASQQSTREDTAMPRTGAAPQPCRALCARRAEDDRFLYESPRLRGQRRRRGRPHHLPVAQPERPPSGRAGARPHHRSDDRRWCSRCRSMSARSPMCSRRLPQGARRRLRGHPPDLPRQRLVGLFPGPRGQPDRDVLRHAVVRAAAARASRSTSKSPRTNSTARPKPIAATARASSRWRNGAPRSARRSRRASRRRTD